MRHAHFRGQKTTTWRDTSGRDTSNGCRFGAVWRPERVRATIRKSKAKKSHQEIRGRARRPPHRPSLYAFTPACSHHVLHCVVLPCPIIDLPLPPRLLSTPSPSSAPTPSHPFCTVAPRTPPSLLLPPPSARQSTQEWRAERIDSHPPPSKVPPGPLATIKGACAGRERVAFTSACFSKQVVPPRKLFAKRASRPHDGPGAYWREMLFVVHAARRRAVLFCGRSRGLR